MVNNNPLPKQILPESWHCRMICDNGAATADLLKEMQTANVPLIPTNDKIQKIVDVIGRPGAQWDNEIAQDVIKIYDTIAPWAQRIGEVANRCFSICDCITDIKRGQNPNDNIFNKWDILIEEYKTHAIAYRTHPEATPGNEQAAEATETDDAQSSPKVDADRLGSFFNAKFKGAGNNPKRIDDLVNDIEKIKVTKELAMIAVMIYDCRQYFIRRPSTFAAWLREFFNIIGRDCPKDTHKNKYKPDERIERLFYYLK